MPLMKHTSRLHTGFTLIEVLVAIAILSIGLLGVAGLQAAGLKFNQNAMLRSQAILIAQDIADKIRSNRKGMDSGYYDSFSSADTLSKPGCIDTTSGCDAQSLATYHIWDWAQHTVAPVSGAAATVSRDDDTFSVSITWTALDESGTATTDPVVVSFVMPAL